MSSLVLFLLCLLGSGAVVVAVIGIEFTHFSKSNNGWQAGSYQLLALSLFLGCCGLVAGCLSRSLGHVLAILLGLAPVELLAFLFYQVENHGTSVASPAAQEAALVQEEARVEARRAALTRAQLAQQAAIARTHPYTGRDSTQPYEAAEQMPSLTGSPEFAPTSRASYRALAHLLSRNATPHLDPTEPRPDTIPVGFTVGPYGGTFHAQIQYGEIPELGAHTRAEAAVLRAAAALPRLHPGRINGQPVPVRIVVAVPLPVAR
ncbi:hypothetical protein [Hymenobacter properus]|uniref:TonB C-terminal domain-containing protein n=1 Tax=Hymenobacter properus TaxID=2791026 RepID=A0A931BKE2_9BACT|nr:hypothetical protein [Hymenobacter properus]MBF9143858.1 hypothetical protein [Hymenobacter properus]MBR7722672.1 hypothetical protein [Microvirga sp. SRT04]